MDNSLYIIGVILIILWAIGFFLYNAGLLIHVLLFSAMISFLVRILVGKHLYK